MVLYIKGTCELSVTSGRKPNSQIFLHLSFGEKRNGDSVAVADLSVQKVEFWFPALFLTWLCCKTADHSCQGQKYINTDQTEDNDDKKSSLTVGIT